MTFDLDADIVELTPYVPPAGAVALREVQFSARAWLPSEIDQLRELFAQDLPMQEIADRIGRPLHGLRDKVCQLGLRRNSSRPWSELEDAELIKRYEGEPAAAIAQALGRTPSAVYARAKLLGLSEGDPFWSEWEDAQLRAGYAQGVPVKQLSQLIGRPLIGTSCRASLLGLVHKNRPVGWSDAECQRALELAHEGHQYHKIGEIMGAEGYTPRTKYAMKAIFHQLGYSRGWGRPWTAEEDDLLRKYYAEGRSLTPLRADLGRSRESIAHRCGELGLHGTHPNKNGFRQGPDWTDAEEQYLRDHYATSKAKDIAAHLNRPLRAVYCRAFALGLKSTFMTAFTAGEERAIGIAWRNAISLSDLAGAIGRDIAVVSKHAIKMGLPFSGPGRVKAKQTRRASRQPLSLQDILNLEPETAHERAA